MAWGTPAINALNIAAMSLSYKLIGLFLLVCFPFFFIGGPSPYTTPLFGAIWDCGHLVFFAAAIILLHAHLDLSRKQSWLWVSLGVFVVGGLIEIVQGYVGRDDNWSDVLRDLTGAWLGLFWLQAASTLVWLGRLVALALLLPNLAAIFWAAWGQLYAVQQFPVLADFESPAQMPGIKGNVERSGLHYTKGHYGLAIHLTTDKYSGVTFDNFFNSWQGYTRLSCELYNPNPEPLVLTIRVNDVAHELTGNLFNDRFNKTLQLQPGWNHVDINLSDILHAPATRTMNLSEISAIVIFAVQLPKPRDIYMDDLRLQ